jgi:hypothetical protein
MKKLIFLLMFIILAISVYAEKVYIFNFNYDNGVITLKEQLIKEGYFPDRRIIKEGYGCALLDSSNNEVYSFKFELPNKVYTDVVEDNLTKGNVIILDKTDFSFIMPYISGSSNLACYNEGGYEILKESTIHTELSPENNKYLIYIYAFLIIILLFIIFYSLKKANK